MSKNLKLVEIHREDISELPELLLLLSKNKNYRFILLCDDLSFDVGFRLNIICSGINSV